MKVTKETVLDWLKAHNRSRDWLAEKCGAARGTVNNWLVSPRPIPAKAALIIERLMEADAAREAEESDIPQNLVLEFSKEQFSEICDAALAAHQKPRDWAEDQLMRLADADIEEIAAEIRQYKMPVRPSMVAEAHIMAAAGPGIAAEVVDWNCADDQVRVRIVGDSMAPLFADGQVIEMMHKKISRSPYMKKGLIYLVELEGEWMVKRYDTREPREDEQGAEYLTNSGSVGILKSENPDFADIDITGPFEWSAWYEEGGSDE